MAQARKTPESQQTKPTTEELFSQCIANNKPVKKAPPSEDWMTTYSDAITLLLAFFVILLSTATFDPAKFEQVTKAMTDSVLDGSDSIMDFQKLESIIETVAKAYEDQQPIEVTKSPDGIVITLSSNSLFASGSASINAEKRGIIRSLATRIAKLDYDDYMVSVEGHTDNVPIHTRRFPSNWELSAARAINVAKLLVKYGIDKKRIQPIAYADTRPKVPNLDQFGRPIKANQAKNRRIELFVHRMTVHDRFQLEPQSLQTVTPLESPNVQNH